MGRKDNIDMEVHNSNYTLEKINSVIMKYHGILQNIKFNNSEYSGISIEILDKIVKKVKEQRFKYCKMNPLTNICEKKEVGGIIRVNNNIGDQIIKEFIGDGDDGRSTFRAFKVKKENYVSATNYMTTNANSNL